jgi:hypothetical protein
MYIAPVVKKNFSKIVPVVFKGAIRKFLNMVAAHTRGLRYPHICLFETFFYCQCAFKSGCHFGVIFPPGWEHPFFRICIQQELSDTDPYSGPQKLLQNYVPVPVFFPVLGQSHSRTSKQVNIKPGFWIKVITTAFSSISVFVLLLSLVDWRFNSEPTTPSSLFRMLKLHDNTALLGLGRKFSFSFFRESLRENSLIVYAKYLWRKYETFAKVFAKTQEIKKHYNNYELKFCFLLFTSKKSAKYICLLFQNNFKKYSLLTKFIIVHLGLSI